jgi:hypothetical protein
MFFALLTSLLLSPSALATNGTDPAITAAANIVPGLCSNPSFLKGTYKTGEQSTSSRTVCFNGTETKKRTTFKVGLNTDKRGTEVKLQEEDCIQAFRRLLSLPNTYNGSMSLLEFE